MSTNSHNQSQSAHRETLLPYRDLLTKAAVAPEALTAVDRARLLPEDAAYLVGRMRQLTARIDAAVAGIRTPRRTVGRDRRLELLALARRGKLRVFSLPDAELDAIDNTPGLWAELAEIPG